MSGKRLVMGLALGDVPFVPAPGDTPCLGATSKREAASAAQGIDRSPINADRSPGAATIPLLKRFNDA